MARRKQKKKNKLAKFTLIFTLICVTGLGVWLFTKWLNYQDAKNTRYAAFGIPIPWKYDIHGIDVSRYQHLIAWEEVKAMQVAEIKLQFAFIKATEGATLIDPQFKRNWKRSRDNNITRGAYHFFIPSRDGKIQAEHFIKQVGDLKPGDLPPVLDIETAGKVKNDVLKKEVKKWLDTVEEYYGVKPILYTYVHFYKKHLGSDFDSYPLWAAHYTENHEPHIQRDWLFWQHSESGQVNGITAKVDFNVFRGDSATFKKLLIQ